MQTSASGKIILFGEHAVVYGQPAIAVPVTSLRARVRVEAAPPGSGLTIESPGTHQTLRVTSLTEEDAGSSLVFAAQLFLQHIQSDRLPDLTLHLNSDVPIGRGLGSGAAVSTAVMRALSEALAKPISKEDLNALIYEVEKRHHGTPSGIDNTVIVYEQPVYFVRGQPIQNISIQIPFTLLVGDTGYGTPTHLTVGDVRRLYETKPDATTAIFQRIGEIVRQARQAIETGEIHALGALMNENHELLQRLTVSSLELDVLCETALAAGARGAKMSGGGRGGNMLALVTDSTAERVMRALYSAGAARVVKTRVRPMEIPAG
jgi:mevalonate kinase